MKQLFSNCSTAVGRDPSSEPELVFTPQPTHPHGGVRPFHQMSTCLTQLTLGPYVVQTWSRNTPECGVNEMLVLHQVWVPQIQHVNLSIVSQPGGGRAIIRICLKLTPELTKKFEFRQPRDYAGEDHSVQNSPACLYLYCKSFTFGESGNGQLRLSMAARQMCAVTCIAWSALPPSPRATLGPYAWSYCRVLGGHCFL